MEGVGLANEMARDNDAGVALGRFPVLQDLPDAAEDVPGVLTPPATVIRLLLAATPHADSLGVRYRWHLSAPASKSGHKIARPRVT